MHKKATIKIDCCNFINRFFASLREFEKRKNTNFTEKYDKRELNKVELAIRNLPLFRLFVSIQTAYSAIVSEKFCGTKFDNNSASILKSN